MVIRHRTDIIVTNTIMTRRTKPELNEKEEGYSKPLPHFNQPRQCTHKKAHENEQFLTNAEKQELVHWITDFSIACSAPRQGCYSPRYVWLNDRRQQMRKSTSIQSAQCLPQFLHRHSKLLVSSVTSNKRDTQLGVKGTDPVTLRNFTTRYRGGQSCAFQQAFVTVGQSLATTRKGGQESNQRGLEWLHWRFRSGNARKSGPFVDLSRPRQGNFVG